MIVLYSVCCMVSVWSALSSCSRLYGKLGNGPAWNWNLDEASYTYLRSILAINFCMQLVQNVPQVQSTNDRSIVSKQSMCSRGYFSDPFLKYFVPKEARRSPLINRYCVHCEVYPYCMHYSVHARFASVHWMHGQSS